MDVKVEKAPQVCLNCKARKRKCDKTLPSCALCKKLLLKCNYVHSGSSTAVVQGNEREGRDQKVIKVAEPTIKELLNRKDVSVQDHLLQDWRASSSFAAAIAPRYDAKADLPITSASVHTEITKEVLGILTSHGESIPSIVSTYFRTVGVWFPILSPDHLQRRIVSIQSDPSSDLAALVLVMYIIIHLPPLEDEEISMQTPLYFAAKSLLTGLLSAGAPSIEGVQAWTLMSLYEHGHGMVDVGQVSIVISSKMAKRLISNLKSTENANDTIEGRLWWGIIILERYMNLHLSGPEIYLTASHTILPIPTDSEKWYMSSRPDMKTPSGCTVGGPTTTLGPFCRTTQAAVLVSDVLQLVSSASLGGKFKADDIWAADAALQALAMNLLQQAVHSWEECCAAIGFCMSAIFTLHTAVLTSSASAELPSDTRRKSLLALQSATNVLLSVAERFIIDLAFIELPTLPIAATFTIYQAALTHVRFAGDEFATPNWKKGLATLKTTVGLFGRKWAIGKTYPKLIDEAVEEEVKRRMVSYKELTEQRGP